MSRVWTRVRRENVGPPLPRHEVMLPSNVSRPPQEGWAHEAKLDGSLLGYPKVRTNGALSTATCAPPSCRPRPHKAPLSFNLPGRKSSGFSKQKGSPTTTSTTSYAVTTSTCSTTSASGKPDVQATPPALVPTPKWPKTARDPAGATPLPPPGGVVRSRACASPLRSAAPSKLALPLSPSLPVGDLLESRPVGRDASASLSCSRSGSSSAVVICPSTATTVT